MDKLLKWHDKYTLKILVSFLILFTALYPKLPSVHIDRTWVYIRLEDFAILATVLVWFIQFARKKISIPWPLAFPILGYWVVGLTSLIVAIIFIAPQLLGFFPHVAALSFARRIEYMILFFVAFSTIKSTKDVKDYVVILAATLIGILIYGLGQKYYLYLWAAYPEFFKQYSFCFPSFQTGNEEFAKGIPLCLPENARINATFAGHYDLAAYLVLVVPIFIAIYASVKKWYWKLANALLAFGGLVLLVLTASRTSYMAYLIATVFSLILFKKKWYIIPVVLVSILLLVSFSETTAKRLLATFRISSIVTDSQGKLIGEELPQDLKNKLDSVEAPPPAQNLPAGSAFLGLPAQQTPVATNVAMLKQTVSASDAEKLKVSTGSIQISTVSGSFLVRKALVYDISFTTRFQAEWPNAWTAFMRNPLFGSGYSSITLATDNDYLRALGETGLLGLFSFMFIFIMLGIAMKQLVPHVTDPVTRGFLFGLAGGMLGLILNAVLIDVFEASKVAENMWMLLGIGAGGLYLYKKKSVNYLSQLKALFTSPFFIALGFILITLATFAGSIMNFFVGDDFTWLRWAASGTFNDIPGYFINADNFFYRPLAKTLTLLLYNVFSFQPQGYHLIMIFLHFMSSFAVYFLAKGLFKQKLPAFLAGILFLLHPAHAESIYWFSTLSGALCSMFILYAMLSFFRFREKKSVLSYVIALVLSIGAFMSYELAVALPFLLLFSDLLLFKSKGWKLLPVHLPFFVLLPLYGLIRHLTSAFSGGGDYSYNLSNLIPNIAGNIFGYAGLFVASDRFFPLYESLRGFMRNNQMLFVVIALAIIALIIAVGYIFRKSLLAYLRSTDGKIFIFGLGVAVLGSLPFLGLGNIAERYFYLGSVGYVIAFIALIRKWFTPWLLVAVVLAISMWFQLENIRMSDNWKNAGATTQNTLMYFRLNHASFEPTDTLYFARVPAKVNEAWVFPVGLRDGLWFIYREKTPVVTQVKDVENANEIINASTGGTYYIFFFDKNGAIVPIK